MGCLFMRAQYHCLGYVQNANEFVRKQIRFKNVQILIETSNAQIKIRFV